jgi:hypothetical protein
MNSFIFPRHLPSIGRWECDIRFISTMGSTRVSARGVIAFVCRHFCGKTGPYYMRQTLPYTIKERGQQNSSAAVRLTGVWFRLIKPHTVNRYNAPHWSHTFRRKWRGVGRCFKLFLPNWFLMMPSIATKFQYVNSPFFIFPSLTTCFGPCGPSSGEIYN